MTQQATDLPTKVLRIRAYVENVFLARNLVQEAVDIWGIPENFHDDMKLVFTELVTNAVKYAEGTVVTGTIVHLGEAVRFNVWDCNTANRPVVKDLSPEAEDGRGLYIVTAPSSRTGISPNTRQGGKWVWAEIDISTGEG